MSTVTADVEVNVPIDVAYNQWTQFEELPNFMQGVEKVKQIDNTRLHWIVNYNGVNREYDSKILEQVPDHHISWKSEDGLNAGLVAFERLGDDKTRVTMRVDWQPQGALESMGSALNLDEDLVETDLRRFKDRIETTGTPTDGWRGTIREGHVVS